MPFARVNDLVLHWQVLGPAEAPAVVLINSLGTDFRIWADVAARLAGTYRVVLYDKRGHGLSEGRGDASSMADHAADLLALLDHLGIARFALVGLSIGGLIAQTVAAHVPERVTSLVLSNTAARIGTAESWAARIAAIRAGGLESIADAVMERWFTPAFRASRPVETFGWRTMLVRSPADGYIAACAAIRDADLTGSTAAIRLPTLCLVGDQDGSTPPDLVRATADRIPGARFEIIPSCGHLPCLEQPEIAASLIAAHFAETLHV
ncbi:3-oxoadipate enol-lactonase [Segnochrobactrum spirostomi]|uniref:3-oxoadipate enol-lactonase n=1 Tax=Segnochrobactrum spirostomi TaxID=2608987 RepID=A0A6A7XXP9_9HYPH|nr:3-oxoadipate enol-lactonase [Segnochrobactrum spirostomi]MQT11195.1 3-oxoadipate enol-lactonase [Segnochrobactrum spirostomi]